jgi:hypothetical protein
MSSRRASRLWTVLTALALAGIVWIAAIGGLLGWSLSD